MTAFAEFVLRKTRLAREAHITPLRTIADHSEQYSLDRIGNAWTRRVYDGPFHVSRLEIDHDLPAMSLVFVQSRAGNTRADNPADLGGGDIDKHLLYEGLSRVAADAVLSGATTARGDVFFSTWHPELVALRASLGLSRHPAQVVLTARGRVDVPASLIFNVPEVPAFILGSEMACAAVADSVRTRPWVTVIPIEKSGIRGALARLRADYGITRISAIGGRTTATALVDAGLVQDLYLTTTCSETGEPDTPWYSGRRPPKLEKVVAKAGRDPELLFEHFRVV